MPLESLYLSNFRLFKEKKINFEKNHTFIFGKNGSGKTSLLEAINLIYSRIKKNGKLFFYAKA